MSLYKLWEKGKAPEWRYFYDFVAWVNANKYKEEYGYKGGFTPENLLAKIPRADKPKDLSEMKVAELRELANEKGIDVKGLKKDEIIKAIEERSKQ